MNKSMDTLAQKLGISRTTLRKFIEDFNLEIDDVLDENLDLKDSFIQFAEDNASFLKKYEKDIQVEKTSTEIADRIKQPVQKVEEILKQSYPNTFDTNGFKTSVSSYGIDNQLGGDYQFVYNYFGKKTPVQYHDFIGYRDLFFYLVDAIEPFVNPRQLTDWGIARPTGIILYGPPGSGKIFWAKKIAKMIGYQFIETKNNYFSIIFKDGKTNQFTDFLCDSCKTPKSLIFMEHFKNLAQAPTEGSTLSPSVRAVKNTILQSIHHNLEDQVLFVGSVNYLTGLDEEITAPGRFDVVIPIFPPNVQERAQMILAHMTRNLSSEAPLIKVLKLNDADKIPFWMPTAQRMKLFSNTMLIDFTQALKKRIHAEYMRVEGKNVVISEKIIHAALSEATAKLTPEYLNQCANFIGELALNNGVDFPYRIQNLALELDQYRAKEAPIRKIGFNIEEEEGSDEENSEAEDQKEKS